MAYEKLNLADGQVFTAAHVAHIESGIAEAEGMIVPKYTVNVQLNPDGSGSFISDKTFEEIQSAINAGYEASVLLKPEEAEGYLYLPLLLNIPEEQLIFSIYMGNQVTVLYLSSGVVQVNFE